MEFLGLWAPQTDEAEDGRSRPSWSRFRERSAQKSIKLVFLFVSAPQGAVKKHFMIDFGPSGCEGHSNIHIFVNLFTMSWRYQDEMPSGGLQRPRAQIEDKTTAWGPWLRKTIPQTQLYRLVFGIRGNPHRLKT